jgi:hypothetical protein
MKEYKYLCEHYWERRGRCCNKEFYKNDNDEILYCPYQGKSSVKLLGFNEIVKCKGFKPREIWCESCEKIYIDGEEHNCKREELYES